mmetsp:Transcript_30815/g.87170  ORF Transcript_30815/g.87170 Transcript_30815/m.87170 type:complete len:369 (+) Transcript_30815:895-2001(+)
MAAIHSVTQVPDRNAGRAGRTVGPCSGDLPGEWQGEEWAIDSNQGCQLTTLPTDWADAFRCLRGKRIAFVGDSHLRNAFRCVAEQLTNGTSRRADGCYGQPWNDPSEPGDWPKYSHVSLHSQQQPLAEEEAGGGLSVAAKPWQKGCGSPVPGEAMHMHELSCSNHFKVHRHDYSVALEGPGGRKLELDFYWQPWGGDEPLLETDDFVEQMGWQAATYRFNYTGGRSRSGFIASLKDSPRGAPDLVIAGGEARQHAALFQHFPGAAVLLNHAGMEDQLDTMAARHGIPVADITSAINAQQPLFTPPLERGNYGIPRVQHPPAQALRFQSNLVVTLAMQMLCPAPSQPSARHATHIRAESSMREDYVLLM